jgi:hypothetical protein
MEFRTETRTETKSVASLTIAALFLSVAFAQSNPPDHVYEVRHHHWHGSDTGTLQVTANGITFEEHRDAANSHSRTWRYSEIEQLTLIPTELRVLTYEDSKWKLGRDRDYTFDRLPKNLSSESFPLWTGKLDQRFIAAVPEPGASSEWKTRAKLDHGLSGTVGSLLIGKDAVVFDAGKPGLSRSWRLIDIENISRTGQIDLTVTTTEKSGWFRGGTRQFHFQLQQRLPEETYNALWREINRSQEQRRSIFGPFGRLRQRQASLHSGRTQVS